MCKHQRKSTLMNSIVSAIFFALMAGCVSQPPAPEAPKPKGTVFYPAPPESPRYQFLTSFKGAEDFEGKEESSLKTFLGKQQTEGFQFKKPYGVIIRDGQMYVGDTIGGVFHFDLINKKLSAFKGSKGLGKIVQPINLSLDKEGNMYVCDTSRKQVLQYDKNDIFIRAFSYKEAWKPVAAEVYEGKLYVADSTTGAGGIKVFDLKTGVNTETIGLTGPQEQTLGIAVNLAFDKDGFIYVMDARKFMIMKYDRDGHYRGSLGGPGDSPGFMGRPRGIAIDRAGRMYAVDAAFDTVQVFAPTGQLLTFFGNEKDVPGSLTLPAGIFLDYDNIELFKKYAAPGFDIEYLIFVTSQFNKYQVVNVYAYGTMQGATYKSDTVLYQELLEKLEREKAEK
ncbi:MAG: hypothetical protein PHI06_03765 [Desulfobulbaceae bacterium]|nr:hypothetical protein [Desulfobulbaceae bacterium]